jgi:hypothetical protein
MLCPPTGECASLVLWAGNLSKFATETKNEFTKSAIYQFARGHTNLAADVQFRDSDHKILDTFHVRAFPTIL